jgi:XTP/dITP diphosphohydrolase
MITLLFASNNEHKAKEIEAALEHTLKIQTLKQAGMNIEIPEPYDTLEENASQKAWTIYKLTKEDCFAEDTGLEVTALNGAPGVKSARYAGEERDAQKNIALLLENLKDKQNREARFKTVISLIWKGKEYFFTGICEGTILSQPRGSGGFGYDAAFMPLGATKTFAEMTIEEKNQYSHRKKAIDLLKKFLLAEIPS